MGPKVKYDLKPKPKVKAKAKAKAKTGSKLSPINTMARVMGEFETLLCENNNLSRTSQRLIQSHVFKYSILSAPLCSINSVIGFLIAGLHYISEVLLTGSSLSAWKWHVLVGRSVLAGPLKFRVQVRVLFPMR